METITLFDQEIPRLGLGCWAIGGPFYADDKPLGYGDVDDLESMKALAYAYESGIRYFDTAAVYGAGHSERVVGEALKGKHDAIISTKVGIEFDPESRRVLGENTSPTAIRQGVEDSLRRLQRDRIDLIFLHLNPLDTPRAHAVFDTLDELVKQGKIRSYGWSTDFSDKVRAVAGRRNFMAVQHAMNLFFAAPKLLEVVEEFDLISFCRSPLAMGLLTGKFEPGTRISGADIRTQNNNWMDYFEDGRVSETHLETLAKVRDILTQEDRTPAQAAIAWIWSRNERCIPIPGFRTQEQVQENVGALEFGRLPRAGYQRVEELIERPAEYDERER